MGTALFSVACSEQSSRDLTSPLAILKVIQTDLFPQDAVSNANAYRYLSVILNHSRVTDEDKQYLKNTTRWVNEEAQKEYKMHYVELTPKQRQNILKVIAKESWGRSVIKTVLIYIMEASLGDPIYGINKNESGWKWLSHEPGFPRPKEAYL